MTMSILAARGLELLLLLGCVAVALATPGGGTRQRIAMRVRQAAGQHPPA
ncbi:type II secretion system F family protein, partial [Burkholderia sp. Se-20378]|nr:type II secretion system F family protein [Burkholderia sp. Se-20378]